MTSSHFNAMDKLMKAGIDALERKPEPPRGLAQIEVEAPARDERLDSSLLETLAWATNKVLDARKRSFEDRIDPDATIPMNENCDGTPNFGLNKNLRDE
jgi:hypothetical protein